LRALEKQIVEDRDDERLQVDAAKSDPACFAELYENNFARVYAYVGRRVRTREEAQDATADIFQKALEGLPRFQWRGLPFAAWLLGIASNVLSDRWKHTLNHNEVAADELEQIGIEDNVEQRAMLYQLVELLPDDQRLVIVRRFIGQKSLREIASELDRSEGAIKQLQLRALQNLRDQMRSDNE
jgi:RNA polymerase sigma-70 factor (ECF subfamily)